MEFVISLNFILLILFSFNGNVISDDGIDCEPYKDESCLKLYNSAGVTSYEDAENFCKNENSHLSSIGSQDKQNFIEDFLKNHSVVDNVWIGLKFIGGNYVWSDGSPLTFSNWVEGSPKNVSENCVEITTENDKSSNRFGKWTEVDCLRKNAVLCEKTKLLSDDEIQKAVMELIKKTDELEKAITNLNDNPVPIGFIYVQLPNETLPEEIWPSVIWSDVTSEYAGLFFRAEGGESDHFGAVQEESNYILSAGWVSAKCNDITATEDVEPGKCAYIDTENKFANDNSGHNSIKLYVKRKEVRPRNTAIRIFKRTA